MAHLEFSSSEYMSDSNTDTPSDLDAYDDYVENPAHYVTFHGSGRGQINSDDTRHGEGTSGQTEWEKAGHRRGESGDRVGGYRRHDAEVSAVDSEDLPDLQTEITRKLDSSRQQRQEENKKPTPRNINSKFVFGEDGESKSLKHWILEACLETLQNKISEVQKTRKPGIAWTPLFGIEAIWQKQGTTLEDEGYSQTNLKKSIDRVIQKATMKPLTGIGELGNIDPMMRPSREEGNEDVVDNTTKELIENIIAMRSMLENDRKLAREETASSLKSKSKYEIRENHTAKEDHSVAKKMPVGMEMQRRRAGEARSNAAFSLGQPEEDGAKRMKVTSNSSGGGIHSAIVSISEMASERMRNDQERMRMEKEDREERRREKEEQREEKRREREEKEREKEIKEREGEREKKFEDKINKTIDAKFDQMREEGQKRDENFKKYLSELLKK